jgi:hypothetical protein
MTKPITKVKNKNGILADTNEDYAFTDAEIEALLKTKQDFIDGKTTARSWTDIEEDLVRACNFN